MRYNSAFDIIGPIMVGPSSSHTAGAVRIGRICREIFGSTPAEAEIYFYGSFAQTYSGHGTDVAIVAGLLGLSTFDPDIPHSFELASDAGLKFSITPKQDRVSHPNTAKLVLSGPSGRMEITGISVGGGSVMITDVNGFRMQLSGDSAATLMVTEDHVGVIAAITELIAEYKINIAHLEFSRQNRGASAMLVLESDDRIGGELVEAITSLAFVKKVIQIKVD